MFEESVIGLDEALKAMQAMLEQAMKEPERPIAIAIVDANGKLVQYARMDRCRALPQQIAFKKAYTAAVMRSDTAALAERFQSMGRNISDFGDPNMLALQGGVLVLAARRRGMSRSDRRQRPERSGGRGPGTAGRPGHGPVGASQGTAAWTLCR